MAAYWRVVCDEQRERIDPDDINEGGVQGSCLAEPPSRLGTLLVFALKTRWDSARLVCDQSDDPAYTDYRNVTEQLIQDYNELHEPILRYTGI